MKQYRTCESAHLNTGVSKCLPDMGKMKGAIIVPSGTKLPADMSGDKLEELVHAEIANRVYGVAKFFEYAKDGGEPQTAANGYGGEEVTGISAMKETFTLDRFHPELNASLLKTANQPRDVYFFDENNILYGINDGTDTLAGFPMSAIYPTVTPHPTSSAQTTMTVTFAHEDAKLSLTSYDYVKLSFNPLKYVLGLTAVELHKVGDTGNSYKILEKVGAYDVTAIYGEAIADAGIAVINGATSAVSYNSTDETLTIAVTGNTTPTLKVPKVLYENDIQGIEQV